MLQKMGKQFAEDPAEDASLLVVGEIEGAVALMTELNVFFVVNVSCLMRFTTTKLKSTEDDIMIFAGMDSKDQWSQRAMSWYLSVSEGITWPCRGSKQQF